MNTEFVSVWVEDPEIPDRWLNAVGFGREQAVLHVADLVAQGRRAVMTPFGQKPECRECHGFTDEPDQLCDDCKRDLPVAYAREVA